MQSHPIRRAVPPALPTTPKSESGPARIARLGAVNPAILTPDTLLRNEQAAALLNVPLSTFHLLRKKCGRDFPRPVRIGARLRWRWGALQTWIHAQEAAQ